jgi:CHAD domain-containing protein
MAYRLDLTGSLGEAARRAVAEQLGSAIEALEGGADDAVHSARKSVKKARAVVRLVRPCLPRSFYRGEQRELRDAGRLLSATRDAEVMLATAAALSEYGVGRLPAAGFEGLRAALREQPPAGEDDVEDPVGAAIEELREIAARITDWPLERCRLRDIRAGAARTYADGHAAWLLACGTDDAKLLHDWRKRVKDLWYQHRLLRNAWPDVLGAFSDAADALGKRLGDDHDLAVLAERLDGLDLPPAADVEVLGELIAERRAELRAEAFAIGERLYAERPAAYKRRMKAYLRAARRTD